MPSGRMRGLFAAFCLFLAVAASGCLELDRALILNKDLTGRAEILMTCDLGGILPSIAEKIRQVEGKTGPPSPEDVAAVKSALLGQAAQTPIFDFKSIATGLPVGMSLTDSSQKIDDARIRITMVIAFRDVSQVPAISLPMAGQAPDQDPIKPFEDVEFKDDGATLLITTKDGSAAAPDSTASIRDMFAQLRKTVNDSGLGTLGSSMVDAIKGVKFRTRIASPLEVIDSNAPKKEGATLVWELSLDGVDLSKATDVKVPPVKVRLRKARGR